LSWKLGEINNKITIHGVNYNLRGVIAFDGPERGDLRQTHGHYVAYCLRSNQQWESYDDTKDQVSLKLPSFEVNAEILFYTK